MGDCLGSWTLSSFMTAKWQRHSGPTPTEGTGPNTDHTNQNDTGKCFKQIVVCSSHIHNYMAWIDTCFGIILLNALKQFFSFICRQFNKQSSLRGNNTRYLSFLTNWQTFWHKIIVFSTVSHERLQWAATFKPNKSSWRHCKSENTFFHSNAKMVKKNQLVWTR